MTALFPCSFCNSTETDNVCGIGGVCICRSCATYAIAHLDEVESRRFLGYDSDDPETQRVIWTGDTIPQSADGLTAIPAGVVEIEDTQG